MAGRLAGKVALVTGSAQGMGEAEARLFVREGAQVVLGDVSDGAGQALASELTPNARFVHLDVTDRGQWDVAVNLCAVTFGGLDILVNNAGIGLPPRRIEEEEATDHRRMLDVNLDGVWHGMRAVMPALVERGGGSIVNISSIDGIMGVAGMATYAASKFAVTGMTRSVALEAGSRGIRVNSVHPGVIETAMIATAPQEIRDRLREVMAHQAIPRMGRPEEVAQVVLFLASDDSSYCTGASFVVDGGHIAGPYREGFAG